MDQEINKKHVLLLIGNICLGSLYFGYNMGVYNTLSIVMVYLNGWKGGFEETLYPTLITISASVGCIVSSPLGVQALQYTQGNLRKACIYLDLIGIASVLFQILDSSFIFLLLGRFVSGLVIGLNCSYISTYITEFSPVSMRGITGCMNQIFICSGLFLSFAIGAFLPSKQDLSQMESYTDQSQWRFNLGYSMIFGLVRAYFLSTTFNYDTPSYMHKNGNIAELKAALQAIYTRQEDVKNIIKQLDDAQDEINKPVSKHFDTPVTEIGQNPIPFDNRNTKSYKRRFYLGLFFSISNQLTGINAVMFYSNKIFEDSHQEEYAGIFTSFLGIVLICSTVYGAIISEKYGRRQMIMKGVSAMTGCLFLMSYFSSQDNFVLSFGSICAYLFFFSISQGPLVWAYQAEILDQIGLSISTCVIWIFTLLVGLVFPYLVLGFGVGGAFIFFAVCSLLSLFYFNKELIETKGKTKEQIALEFEGISADQAIRRAKKIEKPLLDDNQL
ncbi:hypothetical protein ABPG74_009808 [Tetrahymena malaccensis]